jgi:hypothetical protein
MLYGSRAPGECAARRAIGRDSRTRALLGTTRFTAK